MAKVLIYFHKGQKKSSVGIPDARGVDCILAKGLDDLSNKLNDQSEVDLLILDSVPQDQKPEFIQKIKTIKDIPVIFFEQQKAKPGPSSGSRSKASHKGGTEVVGPVGIASPRDPMEAARQYMDENFRKQLTLEEIAERAGISPSYFCRKFKSIYGETPINYLRSLRITRASYLLEHTNLPLAEITRQSGFFSVSYFCREFKRDTGVSPIQHRRNKAKAKSAEKKA